MEPATLIHTPTKNPNDEKSISAIFCTLKNYCRVDIGVVGL